MAAREFLCKVIELKWLSASIFSLRFEPSSHFSYLPGQFLSVVLPEEAGDVRSARRIYSFASPGRNQYELCVQKLPDGRGSSYLASLKAGDVFRVSAPYGDFLFETQSSRNACFIATGSGLAPFRAMILSEQFRKTPPNAALVLFGARAESDILYPGVFESRGVEVVHALTAPSPNWNGFKGRVTDFLKTLPESWPWSETDFYLCGNGYMIQEVHHHLAYIRHVATHAIRQEAYFSTHAVAEKRHLKKAA
jgi:CDP-4-dehydro-6-deoxyglucose reductase